jgi:hypothetical protein
MVEWGLAPRAVWGDAVETVVVCLCLSNAFRNGPPGEGVRIAWLTRVRGVQPMLSES